VLLLLESAYQALHARWSEPVPHRARQSRYSSDSWAAPRPRRHRSTYTSAEIAEMLNAAGLTTGKGRPFTPDGVRVGTQSQRTLVYPVGPRQPGDLPAEDRRLLPLKPVL